MSKFRKLANRAKEGISGALGKISGKATKFGSRAQAAAQQIGAQAQGYAKKAGQSVQDAAKTVGTIAQDAARATPLGAMILPPKRTSGDAEDEPRAAAAKSLLRKKQAGAGQISYTTSELT